MNDKRIASYMAITTVCAVLCCAAAAFPLFENAAFGCSLYEDMLRPVTSLLAAVVLFRLFAVRYRLRLRNWSLWAKLTAASVYPVFLTSLLTAFSALCMFTAVNKSFWDDPIPYTVFLRKELSMWFSHSKDWSVPAALLAAEGLYIFVHESRIGRTHILPALSLCFTSPFREEACDPQDDDAAGETVCGKKTTILQFVREADAQTYTAGTDDGQNE